MASPTPSACAPGSSAGPERAPYDYHPLETIAFFRRFRQSVPRDLLYTLIWNCALAGSFMLVGALINPAVLNLRTAGHVFVISNCIGYTIHAFFMVFGALGIDRKAHARGGITVVAYYTAMATAGVFLGFAIAAAVLDLPFLRMFQGPRQIAAVAINSLIISVIISAIFFARERASRAKAELQAERLRVERIEREATLANLRALQAQIEPHFLFNTLANVTSLIESHPAKAKSMLETFIRFLRASLAATRGQSTTLGADAELIRAYLEVIQVRMGSRLAFSIAVDEGLSGFELPPMLLQPIVENAVRHGLEPKVEGGQLAFRARREADHVVIEIADTGVGFAPTTSGGVGLTNLRDRLKLLYGERASFAIRENAPAGTLITLRIPA